MTTYMRQTIEGVKNLTAHERALVARCLISSLETKQDEDVDFAWAALAEERYLELFSGKVKSVPWAEIKKKVKG